MIDEYTKLPYIGKKRAKKLREAGITIEKIATMDYDELKKYFRRLSNAKIREIIAVAREIMGKINDISISLSIENEKAKILALNDYDVEKIAKAKKEEIAEILGIGEKDALDIIFKAALKTGIKKKEVKIKGEYINKVGIVSKEGFINGFTSFKPSRKEGIKILPILIVLIVILSGILVSLLYTSPSIKIDGNFTDWRGIGGFIDEKIDYKFSYYNGVLYFYIQKQDLFKNNESVYIAIDNGKGGYYLHGINVNTIVELYGWESKVQGAHVWKYKSSKYLWDFTSDSGLIYSFKDSQIEGRLNNVEETSKLLLIDKSKDYYVSAPIVVSQKTVIVEEKSITDIIENDKPVYLIRTISDDSFRLDYIDFQISGAKLTSGRLEVGGQTYSGKVLSGGLRFNINKRISSTKFVFSGKFSGNSGSVVEIRALLHGEGVKFSYKNETSKFYLFSSPGSIQIDGAFGDWKNINSDVIGDVSDENIDLTNYSYTPDFSKVFMEVRGEFMGGDDVPLFRHWAPKDSDRDTVPDKYDPMPHDFNNDGIPDDETDFDVDGDGFKDYPHGNDTWLNTTIPYDFPAPYAGRHVSVYIGPPPPQKPKNGNDTAEIYFGDGDSKGAHLYWVPFPVDYKITITGRDGIYTSSLYKYSNGHWNYNGKVKNIASGYSRMELSTGITMTHGKIWITVFNWHKEYDTPSFQKVTRASTTTNVFYLHADSNSNPSNMNWTVGNNEMSVTLNDGDSVFWRYENPIAENYYIQNATVNVYLSDTGNHWFGDKDNLNVTLYAFKSFSEHTLLMWSGEKDITGNSGMTTIYLDKVRNDTVYRDWYLVLYLEYSTNNNNNQVDIYYNTTHANGYDSNLTILTNTTMKIKNVWTENATSQTSFFKAGERVNIFANVTDPLGWEHINYTHLTVIPSHSGMILSVPMNRLTNGFGYSIFNYSYILPSDSYVGKYDITVDAYDVEGFKDSGGSYFTLPGDLLLKPKWERIFVPPSPFSAWFKHLLVNNGSGRDIFNFNISSAGNYEITIYNDTNRNRILDGSDVLLAKYDSGWTYIKYDNDSNGDPDIELNMGASASIIVQENVSLSNTHPADKFNLTVYSTLGGTAKKATDLALLREVKNKTLYLKGGGDINTGIPDTLDADMLVS